jgi:hypothetical protein
MIYKRGQTFWYKFNWSIRQRDGTLKSFLVRRSARTKVAMEAEEVEHEHRRAIRLGEVHPLDPWPKPGRHPKPRCCGNSRTAFLSMRGCTSKRAASSSMSELWRVY